MAILTKEIIEATEGKLLSGNSNLLEHKKKLLHNFRGVSIDSRTISDGEIFVALRGARFDGHDFLEDALLKGDGAVIDSKYQQLPDVHIPRDRFREGKIVIYVEDTLKALQDLAHSIRKRRNIPVVVITGSNGKTTTKEMTHAILSKRFKAIKNEGNLNNHIGLPLSLTGLAPDDEVIVLELGMNAPGEIKKLCDIAVPSHGIITNIAPAHIGGLGDLESIRSAKFEILQGLAAIVLNADDTFLMQGYKSILMNEGFDGRYDSIPSRLITFSINSDSHVKAENVVETDKGSRFILKIKEGKGIAVTLNVHGIFNVYNALAASAVSFLLGSTIEEIKNALENYRAFPKRFEVIKRNNITLIDDSYNANPSSMEAALRELVRMKGKGRTVAVFGDMLELGKFSEKAHSNIMKLACDIGINVFVAVGEMMSFAAVKGKKINDKKSLPAIYSFKNADEAIRGIMDILREGDTVLVKGSRAMTMEKIVNQVFIPEG